MQVMKQEDIENIEEVQFIHNASLKSSHSKKNCLHVRTHAHVWETVSYSTLQVCNINSLYAGETSGNRDVTEISTILEIRFKEG